VPIGKYGPDVAQLKNGLVENSQRIKKTRFSFPFALKKNPKLKQKFEGFEPTSKQSSNTLLFTARMKIQKRPPFK
jgi:hypothetical protein